MANEHIAAENYLVIKNNGVAIHRELEVVFYPWNVKTTKGKGYILLGLGGEIYGLHRLIWAKLHGEIPEGKVIDHIDRNIYNNHPSNLRCITVSENAQNRATRQDNKSGYRGVSYDKPTGRWRVEITVDGTTIRLGRFNTLDGAIEARKRAELKYHPATMPDGSAEDLVGPLQNYEDRNPKPVVESQATQEEFPDMPTVWDRIRAAKARRKARQNLEAFPENLEHPSLGVQSGQNGLQNELPIPMAQAEPAQAEQLAEPHYRAAETGLVRAEDHDTGIGEGTERP